MSDYCRTCDRNNPDRVAELAARLAEAEEALRRAAYVAENLHGMIDRETWRAHGGDDGQGHYEGDYHAEQIADEIKGWQALAARPVSAEGDKS